MNNHNYTVCSSAASWALGRLSFSAFNQVRSTCVHFRNLLSRGGFKVRDNTFRDPSIVKRIVRFLQQDSDAMRMVLLAQISAEGKNAKVILAYNLLERKWLQKNWGMLLRLVCDPRPWVVAMVIDNENAILRRAGELLLGNEHFWSRDFARFAHEPLRVEEKDYQAIMALGVQYLRFRPMEDAKGKPLNFLRLTVPEEPKLEEVPVKPVVEDRAKEEQEKTPAANINVSVSDNVDKSGVLMARLLPLNNASHIVAKGILPLSASRTPENAAGKEMTQRIQELEEELAAVKREKNELTEQLTSCQKRLGEADQTLEGAIGELREQKEQQVASEMALYRQNVLGISTDLELIPHQGANEQSPLDVRVKLALKSQRDLDKRYGTIAKAKAELTHLEEMLIQVKQAITEAVRVEPTLPALEKELEERVSNIKKIVDDTCRIGDDDLASMPSRFITHIQSIELGKTDTEQKLAQVSQWLDSSVGHALLDTAEIENVRKVLKNRQRLQLEALYASHWELLENDERNKEFYGDIRLILNVKQYQEELPQVELYVDAYNVIKRDGRFSALERTVNGFAIARDEFIRRCGKIAPYFKKVVLVFDGELPTNGLDKRNEHFEVVWAAKKDTEHNADRYIIDELTALAQRDSASDSKTHRWVVTDDGGLLAHLVERQCCGARLFDQTFTALLG